MSQTYTREDYINFSLLIENAVNDVVGACDGIEWGTVEGVSGVGAKKRYKVRLSLDQSTVVEDLINATGFALTNGDVVLLLKIQNALSNSFIIAKKNASFEAISSENTTAQTSPSDTSVEDQAFSSEEFLVGQNQNLAITSYEPYLPLGATVGVLFYNDRFRSSAQWRYGQPFDYGQQLPFLEQFEDVVAGSALSLSVALKISDHSEWIDRVSAETRELVAEDASRLGRQIYGNYDSIYRNLIKRIQPGDTLFAVRKNANDISAPLRVVSNCPNYKIQQ